MAAVGKPRLDENPESSLSEEYREGDYVLLCKRGVWLWGRIVNVLDKGYLYILSMSHLYRYGDILQCHRRHIFEHVFPAP